MRFFIGIMVLVACGIVASASVAVRPEGEVNYDAAVFEDAGSAGSVAVRQAAHDGEDNAIPDADLFEDTASISAAVRQVRCWKRCPGSCGLSRAQPKPSMQICTCSGTRSSSQFVVEGNRRCPGKCALKRIRGKPGIATCQCRTRSFLIC